MQFNHSTINKATQDLCSLPLAPKSFLLALLCLIATFVSCNKDDKEPTPSIFKIKSITRTTSSGTTIRNYEYDVRGRIIKISGSERFFLRYVYRKDTIIRIDSLQQQTDTLLLNKEGLVVSTLNKWMSHEYNTDGQMVRTILSNPLGQIGVTYEYKVTDGNITTSEIWAFQKLSYSNDFKYLPNSVNTIGNENMGTKFYGKQGKNLISVCIATTHENGEQKQINYRYEMDAQNRVAKRLEDSPSGNIYEEFSYY